MHWMQQPRFKLKSVCATPAAARQHATAAERDHESLQEGGLTDKPIDGSKERHIWKKIENPNICPLKFVVTKLKNACLKII